MRWRRELRDVGLMAVFVATATCGNALRLLRVNRPADWMIDVADGLWLKVSEP